MMVTQVSRSVTPVAFHVLGKHLGPKMAWGGFLTRFGGFLHNDVAGVSFATWNRPGEFAAPRASEAGGACPLLETKENVTQALL